MPRPVRPRKLQLLLLIRLLLLQDLKARWRRRRRRRRRGQEPTQLPNQSSKLVATGSSCSISLSWIYDQHTHKEKASINKQSVATAAWSHLQILSLPLLQANPQSKCKISWPLSSRLRNCNKSPNKQQQQQRQERERNLFLGDYKLWCCTCQECNSQLVQSRVFVFFQISWTISIHCDYLSQFLFFSFLTLPSVRESMESGGCQPTQKQKKKGKELFLPNCPTVVMTHKHRVSPAVEGPTSYKKRKKTKKTKQKRFSFSTEIILLQCKWTSFVFLKMYLLLLLLLLCLCLPFFLANGFLICSRARAHTHTQKLAKQTTADKKNNLEGEEEEEEGAAQSSRDSNSRPKSFYDFYSSFNKSSIFHISVTTKVFFKKIKLN